MRPLVLKISMSLDGYVGGPNGEMDWAIRTSSPEGKAWVSQTIEDAGVLLAGRGLYTSWIGYWPTSTDPIAPAMNKAPKIVFTKSGELDLGPDFEAPPGWDDTRVLGTDTAAEIEALKAEDGDYLLAQGGSSFARSLVGLGLVDEYRLVIPPVVLGSGAALFAGAPELDLELVDSVAFPGGTQALTYRPR